MKIYFLSAALVAVFTCLGYSQGTIVFNDYFSTGRVYSCPEHPTLASGVFTVELYYGPLGTPFFDLKPDLASLYTTSANTTGGVFYDTVYQTLPGITGGYGSSDTVQNVELAIIGWYGSYTSAAAAEAAGAFVGETQEFTNPTGGGGSPQSAAANLVGWTSANPLYLTDCPEPVTIVFGALGAVVLWAFRGRK